MGRTVFSQLYRTRARACVITFQERPAVRSDRSLLTCMRLCQERPGALLTHAFGAVDSGALLTRPHSGLTCMQFGALLTRTASI